MPEEYGLQYTFRELLEDIRAEVRAGRVETASLVTRLYEVEARVRAVEEVSRGRTLLIGSVLGLVGTLAAVGAVLLQVAGG